MTLEIADFLRPRYREQLTRYAAFLDCTAALDYDIGPVGQSPSVTREFTATYKDEHFYDSPYLTLLKFSSSNRREELITSLFEASYLMMLVADQPDWLDKLRAADATATDEAIVTYFGIDTTVTCRASVAAWSEGSFLAPHDRGFAHFIVDSRGGLSILSTSIDVMPVALHLAASREADRVNLTSRVAKN